MEKRLQVGIDISRNKLDLCVTNSWGERVIKHQQFANNLPGYQALVQRLIEEIVKAGYQGVDVAAEGTGHYWLPLFLQLQQEAQLAPYDPTLYLLNAHQVHWYKKGYGPHNKTDEADSFYIAEKLRTHRATLTPWHQTPQQLGLRFYSRQRFSLGQAITREKNYLWAHLFLHSSAYKAGQPFHDGFSACGRQLLRRYPDWQAIAQLPQEELTAMLKQWSRGRLADPDLTATQLRQVVADSFPLPAAAQPGLHTLLTMTIDRLELLEHQATQLERSLQGALDQFHPEVNHLVAIKGIGVVLAAGIAAEIGGVGRFLSGQKWDKRRQLYRPRNLRDAEDAIAKFAGLWWPRHASGDFEAQARRLSKKGNHFLRYYLVEAADRLRLTQPQYKAYYQRKYQESSRFKHKRALVLTARKSIGLFVGLLHRNEPYRPPELS